MNWDHIVKLPNLHLIYFSPLQNHLPGNGFEIISDWFDGVVTPEFSDPPTEHEQDRKFWSYLKTTLRGLPLCQASTFSEDETLSAFAEKHLQDPHLATAPRTDVCLLALTSILSEALSALALTEGKSRTRTPAEESQEVGQLRKRLAEFSLSPDEVNRLQKEQDRLSLAISERDNDLASLKAQKAQLENLQTRLEKELAGAQAELQDARLAATNLRLEKEFFQRQAQEAADLNQTLSILNDEHDRALIKHFKKPLSGDALDLTLRGLFKNLADAQAQLAATRTSDPNHPAPPTMSGSSSAGRMSDGHLHPAGTIEQVWRLLPDDVRGTDPPQSLKELEEFLNDLADSARSGATGCRHPQELSAVLNPGPPPDESLPWSVSLDTVRDLRAGNIPSAAPPHAPPQGGKLFKASEVPEFTDVKKYWEWRCLFRRFARSQKVEPWDCPFALERVVQRFTGPSLANFAQHLNVAGHAQATWELTYQSLLGWTDDNFLPANFYAEAVIKWRRVHGKLGDVPEEHIIRFQAALFEFEEAAIIQKVNGPSQEAISLQFAASLPTEVREQVRVHKPGFETEPYLRHRQLIVNLWNAQPKPTPKVKTPAARVNVGTIAGSPGTDNQLRRRQCGLTASYDFPAPPVPANLRGPLYYKQSMDTTAQNATATRNRLARSLDVCEACRRPRSAHKQGLPFKPVQPYQGPGTPKALPAPVNPSGPNRPKSPPPAPASTVSEEVD